MKILYSLPVESSRRQKPSERKRCEGDESAVAQWSSCKMIVFFDNRKMCSKPNCTCVCVYSWLLGLREQFGVSSRRLQSYHLFKISRFFFAADFRGCCFYFSLAVCFGRSFFLLAFYCTRNLFRSRIVIQSSWMQAIFIRLFSSFVARTKCDCYRLCGSSNFTAVAYFSQYREYWLE